MTQTTTPRQTIQATKPKEKLNKIEQAKTKKHPLLLKQELEHFVSIGWEAMDEFERNQGFKWLGFFCRTVTPRKQSQTYRSRRHLDRRQGKEGCSLGQRGDEKDFLRKPEIGVAGSSNQAF